MKVREPRKESFKLPCMQKLPLWRGDNGTLQGAGAAWTSHEGTEPRRPSQTTPTTPAPLDMFAQEGAEFRSGQSTVSALPSPTDCLHILLAPHC